MQYNSHGREPTDRKRRFVKDLKGRNESGIDGKFLFELEFAID